MKTRLLILLTGFIPIVSFAAHSRQLPEVETRALQAAAETVELENAALKSGPICSGGDDTVALQALLNHGNPEMTVVEIPATPTGCNISDALYVQSNTHVIQNGLLRFNLPGWTNPAQMDGMYTIVTNAHDVIIEGSGVLDGGIPSFLTPTGCCMGGITTGGGNLGEYNANVRDVTIRGLTFRNIQTWPFALDGVTNARIDGISTFDSPYSAFVGHNSRNVIVTNSRFSRINDTCFAFYRGVEDAILANAIAEQCFGSAVTVFGDYPAGLPDPHFGKNIILNNNIAYGKNTDPFGTGGLDSQGYSPNGDMNEGVSFTFNLARSSNKQGIGMTPAKHGLIAGNMTHSNGAPPPHNGWATGINLLGANSVLVSGNSNFNEGYGSTTGLGVNISGSCPIDGTPDFCQEYPPGVPRIIPERISVMDNYYYDSGAVPTMLGAIVNEMPGPIVVAGNTYAPLLGGFYYSLYTNPNSVVTDNDAQL